MLNINDVLKDVNLNTTYRVLWISVPDDVVYMIDIGDNKFPVRKNYTDIQNYLETEEYVLCNDEWCYGMYNEKLISCNDKSVRDASWKYIETLVTREPEIFARKERGALIKGIIETTGSNFVTISKYLKQYWKFGKTKNALLPNYRNCGGKGKNRTNSVKKLGRPSIYGLGSSVVVDDNIEAIFEKVIKKYYHTRDEYPLSAVYEIMLKEHFSKAVEQPDGNIKYELYDESEIPTIRQFRYWYSKNYSDKERLVSRKGKNQFNLNHRAVLGKSDTNILGPGVQYQIDATVGDIYLVSQFNRANIIGRPVIYFVIDTFSRMIAGMYVGLEGPSWLGAMMALANAASDKVKYCAEYGIDITENEWPCKNIPDTILADRGEMESKSVETLINTLNIRVDNAPAYRADMKGIVEQLFHTVNTKTTMFLPGHVKPDMAQRGGKDYRLDAKLDIRQFTKVMIHCVLNHNNQHYMEGYVRSERMIADEIKPIPCELWNWGIANCSGSLRSAPEETVKLCLMPVDTARVTEKGIKYKGLYYISERTILQGWHEKARSKGSYKVDISYDPRDMSNIYIRNANELLFEKCTLSDWQEKWFGKSLDEIICQQAAERYIANKSKKNELQAKVDLNAEIEKIVSEAESQAKQTALPKSKKQRVSNIQENRAAEKQAMRQQEKFELDSKKSGDDLQTEKSDKKIHPVTKLIIEMAEQDYE